jgi:hypothetical protein
VHGFYFYVTENSLDNQMERGSKAVIIKAKANEPEAAAQEAFININAMTPAFTDFLMKSAEGSTIAFSKGLKTK